MEMSRDLRNKNKYKKSAMEEEFTFHALLSPGLSRMATPSLTATASLSPLGLQASFASFPDLNSSIREMEIGGKGEVRKVSARGNVE